MYNKCTYIVTSAPLFPMLHIYHFMIHTLQLGSYSNMFETRRAKLDIFLNFTFVATCLLLVFTVSLTSKIYQPQLQMHGTRHPLELVDIEIRYRPYEKRVINEEEIHVEDYGNLVPPVNVTLQERIAWFKKKLPQFEFMKSTPVSKQFGNRVEEFLGDNQCSVQFFMTWIAPMSLFGDREFLTMDSLFKAHPNGCLIIISRTMDSSHGSKILSPLVDKGYKVLAVTPDLPHLFKDTPAESWYEDMKSGTKDPGEISLAQNLSNLIRLAVLYKYGGVYLDTDFIVLKDFSQLRNSIGAQSMNPLGNWTRLNNAVLIFDKNHPLLYKFIEEFALNFNGNKWGYNGPYLVSRVVSNLSIAADYNFTILPPMAFYPVYWSRVDGFFMGPKQVRRRWIEHKLQQLTNVTYGMHLWNKQSSRLMIEQGSIMQRLISEHCTICKHEHSS